ncbi:hypothetical protein P4T54_30250 [Bacillus mycoides]|uniref:hypothetical protein n=1 Tax=Bacillus mycoides TaxID=1405 RepID=UPI002E1DEC39|nr:hypothetical protein [Bacillus mycoides]MED1048611.1 hypothetical protein [Bacillus mycoides]MED1052987.1 hypothetical protein [Bacillus mycoides]
MSEAFYIYECHNCNHVFSAKVLVDGVGQCMKCRHDSVYLKPQSTGVYEERVEHKDVLEVLSNFSTKELIEALNLKDDVQVHNTSEDTYKVSMDLMEVKKHVLVINNCNPQLVEHRGRVMEAEMIQFAGGCCD